MVGVVQGGRRRALWQRGSLVERRRKMAAVEEVNNSLFSRAVAAAAF
jgi:hypothetical protein